MAEKRQPKNKVSSDIQFIADLMDTRFNGPFGTRFGVDGIIGLIPGIGDLFTTAVSSYILLSATSQGYPLSLIFRMGLNLLIENIVGVIPLLGNVFDFIWKANSKNVVLMQSYHADSRKTQRVSVAINFFAVSIFVILLAIPIFLASLLAYKILSLI